MVIWWWHLQLLKMWNHLRIEITFFAINCISSFNKNILMSSSRQRHMIQFWQSQCKSFILLWEWLLVNTRYWSSYLRGRTKDSTFGRQELKTHNLQQPNKFAVRILWRLRCKQQLWKIWQRLTYIQTYSCHQPFKIYNELWSYLLWSIEPIIGFFTICFSFFFCLIFSKYI